MKRIFEIRFFEDEFKKIKDAPMHLLDKSSNDMASVIKIPEDHPDFNSVILWSKKHRNAVIFGLAFVRKIYSDEELEQSDILHLSSIDDAPGEMYGDSYGTLYKIVAKCRQYELPKQTSPLFCNTSKLSKKKDLQTLFSSEIIISKRLKETLEKEKLTGFEIKPVYRPTKIRDEGDIDTILSDESKQSKDYFQLIVTANAGHINKKTVFGPNYLDLNEKHDVIPYLPECDLIENIYWKSDLFLNKKDWPNTDFAITEEKVMSQYPHPLIVISQKAYQIFKKNKIKGFEVEPAYFI